MLTQPVYVKLELLLGEEWVKRRSRIVYARCKFRESCACKATWSIVVTLVTMKRCIALNPVSCELVCQTTLRKCT